MNKKEFALWAMALNTYYPEKTPLPTNEAMNLWFEMLSDLPMQVAEAALKKWVATNKWVPTISDIRGTAAEITGGKEKSWGEAWEDVLKAMVMYPNGKEAMESLTETTQTTIKRLGGWYRICGSETPAADRANFRTIYEELAAERMKEKQTPEKVKLLIKNTKLLGGGNE